MKFIDINEIGAEVIADRKGVNHRVVMDGKTTNKNFEFIFSTMDKGGHGKLHNHPHSEHVLMVQKGQLTLSNETEKHVLDAGQGVFVDVGEYHQVDNTFDGETDYLVVYSPPR
jgi:quercetin dioxygenase-like cupin family protein